LSFGEGYAEGSIDVQGNFFKLMRVVVGASAARNGAIKRQSGALARRRARSLAFARRNIYHHYDIGNEFYKLWLDDRMLYTCAYYRDPEMTLEEAQTAKMDHICRKLQLRPGETVIEAGCGWGGFALHMARNYGVTVRAYNISHEQILHARELARSENLDQRVEFVEDDWRNISGKCDAFVSVGMLEHVGIDNYRQLGRVVAGALHPSGRGLIHSIGRNFPAPLNPWIRRHIFPGAEPPSISQAMCIFEERNLSVLDIENIRLHYAVTCRHWLERFEEHADEIRAQFDERFVRMWRLYLASSSVAFECGALQLFQILFAPGRSNAVPWTRDFMYRDDDGSERGAVWEQFAREPQP
jgi:cyclopropane-fatty-acyl-phospholipid synthase